MSECIVRMEMPKKCVNCLAWCICGTIHKYMLGIDCDSDWTYEDLLVLTDETGFIKPDDCPIICQLSDGHGRPGDLDELKNWLVAQIEHYKRFDYGAICSTMVSAYETVCKVIDSMTAIGPTEAESPSPKPTDPLPIRGVEYVPTEVDVQTGTVTYELRERSET